ncbi:integral membrane protein [Geosmithia morbida]|uniref:Integral membrane protein n=1 Tax=Geosmithia morbida TaxID=1094350 RepID=A0A9P4Z5B0_9HYPO|nr:uncharacterized protein GMORB2_0696 [Geosmithia morbida]KAF4126959.1 integral membrane protein [Geosmithia morbida]
MRVVIALSTATTGVCDDVCQGAELNSVATWFRNMCNVDDAAKNTDTTTATATDSASETGSHRKNTGGGGDWLSNHWKWVIMLVVLVVAIVGIWVGACIFRRRYLKKKEQQKFTLKNPGGVSPEGVVGAAGASGTPGAAGPDAAARQSTPAQSGVSSSPSEKIRRWTGRS